MEPLAILGLAGLLFVKEAGVPVPVPGDLLVIGAGVASAGNPGAAVLALVAVLVAGYLGGVVQFLLVRGAFRRAVLRLLTRFGVPEARLEALAARLQRGGARGVAIARVTPGVRVPAIAASGLAALPLPPFATGLITGNTLFVGAHFALGFIVGAPALALLERSGPALIAGGIVVLALVGAIGWLVLRARRQAGALAPVSPASEPGSTASTFAAWADAACPACLALALVATESERFDLA
jgi:membrane protein DedA with SNARE-associated domain